ncbi:hypothetical protein GOP47_0017111 [Adiantum capillus-veneris]|uniref:Uncharacterized protein n=1 Tax=Adiantum capillus-veneris TaxID=13818 RepID=A0A9D4UIZ2_ADICA|nr:hypothetical protein GOP47_0017111 [Adiantum capillus-veneris]
MSAVNGLYKALYSHDLSLEWQKKIVKTHTHITKNTNLTAQPPHKEGVTLLSYPAARSPQRGKVQITPPFLACVRERETITSITYYPPPCGGHLSLSPKDLSL